MKNDKTSAARDLAGADPASNYLDFLNAVFAATQAPIPVVLDGQEHAISDPAFFREHEGELRVSPLTEDGVAFFFGVLEDAAEDSYTECRVKPTAALFKDGVMILVWALDCPATAVEARPIADALGMDALDECIPLPGTDGWALVYVDADIYCTLKDLAGAYGSQFAPTHTKVLGKYGDANILTPFDPTDERYAQEMIITVGGGAESQNWKPVPMTIATLFLGLSEHKEGKKDGTALVLGKLVPGRRLKNAVVSLFGVGLDIDTGMSSEAIDKVLIELGCAAVRYTTHSHFKERTDFKKDVIIRFAPNEELNDDVIRRYLREEKHWDEAIIATASYAGTDHTERGIMATVKHASMPKNRVIIPFIEPFVIADEGVTQQAAMDRWTKVPLALAEKLNIPLDKTGTDPSRLFYFPRHAKNRPYEIAIFGGDLFDWKTLVLDDPLDRLAAEVNKGTSKSKTQGGRDLGRWSMTTAHGFQIADVLEDHAPDRIRGKATSGVDIECPFDENHNNAGDPTDRACFAVNAGEGSHDWFTISCRHESCRDKTMLDMLGKMVTDGWFDRSVLDDEKYNAVEAEDAPQPEVAKKIEKEDKARAEYMSAIEALTPESSDKQIKEAASLVVEAKLSVVMEDRARDTMAKKLKATKTTIKKLLKDARSTKRKAQAVKESHGLELFYYNDEPDFDVACDACVSVLERANADAKLPLFSQMGGEPVRLDICDGRAKFVDMSRDGVWSELCKRIAFVRESEESQSSRKKVPEDVARHIYEQCYTTLPPAPEVLYTPIYTRDGALLLTPGYHFSPNDGLNHLLMLDGLSVPAVPNPPTEQDAKNSASWLKKELLSDFPFCDEDENGKDQRGPSEANALACLTTPFMREMITGTTPLYAIKKPRTGSGATFLGEVAINLFGGSAAPRAPLHYTANEEEMGKIIVAAIKETRTDLFFDDVKEFNNRLLLRSISSKRMGGRVLGQSHIFECENTFRWILTGNNPKIGGEMHRRTCWIRLDPKTPVGTERTYRHTDLMAYLAENRGVAIGHVLTMIEYWLANGAKEFTERGLSGFDDWARKVGGVLEACGVEGFLSNKAALVLDTESMTEDDFLRAMHTECKVGGASISELFEWAERTSHAFVTGRSPDERRRNFADGVAALVDRTFEIKAGDESSLFALRAKKVKADVMFEIVPVTKERAA